MDALVCAPGGSGFLYQLPLGQLINPGGEGVFNVSFDASEAGEWDIIVGAFRDDILMDPQRSSSLDQDQLTIFVPGGTGSSSQAAPTPTPTIELTVEAATRVPTKTPIPGTTVEGTEELPEGAPVGASAVKCVQQEEGEAAGLAGRDANVILVADMSGSMDGGKIIALRETAKDFFQNVTDPAEYIGLVAFESNVRTVIDLTAKGSVSTVEWDQAVDGLHSGGGTAFYDGVAHAIDLMEDIGSRDWINIIIALTDGNDGESGNSLRDVIARIEGSTIPLTVYTIGYGGAGDYDLGVLNQVAAAGGTIRAIPGTPESTEQLFTVLASVFSRGN